MQVFYVAPDEPTHFPVDMLRYDNCFPADESEANAITAALTGGERIGGAIKLIRVGTTARPPEDARWRSFGWKVVDERAARECDQRVKRARARRKREPTF